MTTYPGPPPIPVTPAYLNLPYVRLQSLILDASEKLMAAAAVGARYTETEVRTYGGNLLLSIVSSLAIGPILNRRNRALSDEAALSKAYDEAVAFVESLRRGERIFFAVPNVPEAGLSESASMAPASGMPPLISQQAGAYFGPGANEGASYYGVNPYYPIGNSNPNN
jgi:hypothetical protein